MWGPNTHCTRSCHKERETSTSIKDWSLINYFIMICRAISVFEFSPSHVLSYLRFLIPVCLFFFLLVLSWRRKLKNTVVKKRYDNRTGQRIWFWLWHTHTLAGRQAGRKGGRVSTQSSDGSTTERVCVGSNRQLLLQGGSHTDVKYKHTHTHTKLIHIIGTT